MVRKTVLVYVSDRVQVASHKEEKFYIMDLKEQKASKVKLKMELLKLVSTLKPYTLAV